MKRLGTLLLCWMALCAWSAEPAEAPVAFDIPGQSLSGALLRFSAQSGLQVLVDDSLIARRRVRPLRARLAPTTALLRLLAGTGLSIRRVDAGTIALVRGSPERPAPGSPASQGVKADSARLEAQDGDSASLDELDEVHVTGTRIHVPGNDTAAFPMLTITGAQLQELGIVNIGEAVTTLLPQNMSSWQPRLTGDDQGGSIARSYFFVGNTIINLRGLDPLYGTRTLTLIDGRRVVSTSNQADVVDMNIIPSNLLQRMDVVTGGASATYGSGAMAGVVNLVLDHRLSGIRVDLDYGLNEAGDGSSPHLALSAGTPLLGGRAHGLIGLEWQDDAAIRDCASARRWCALSRTLYQNFSGSPREPNEPLAPLPGLEGAPARFAAADVRHSQFAPAGAIYSSSANNTSGYRFTADGRGIEEYAYGFRGGTGRETVGGDGPLVTAGIPLRPDTERRTAFANFEFNVSDSLSAYVQGNYASTDSLNRNPFTQATTCVRFNTTGIAAEPGGSARAGDFIRYGGNGEAFTDPVTGNAVADVARNPLWNNSNFRSVLGNAPTGRTPPYFIRPGQLGSTDTLPPGSTGPGWEFTNGADPVWQRIRSAQGTDYWNLVGVTLAVNFDDPGTPAVLPTLGRNAYAFLAGLSSEALYQVQRAFGNSNSAGGGAGVEALYGTTPCSGHTAIRKVWDPQVQQTTRNESRTVRAVTGLRGRFGGDWRWEGYYQYGETRSTSRQSNVPTTLSFALAMDAVMDDRVGSPTFGTPVCRITRDGVPIIDNQGRPLSDPEGLAALARGCRPLNVFGTTFTDAASARLQREALAYAFKDNVSDGSNSLHVLSFNASGTLWKGWTGPLTGAFGLELREDRVDNDGSRGPFYLRADIARAWGDAFGGRTRVLESYTELNLPLLSGMEGINLWSVNGAVRYAAYHNRGGAGTTGQSATQGTLNWKISTVFEPFDTVRLRLTRSRDLRAAGYRDLFLNQPSVPDSEAGANPWRQRTADSIENQRERWGTIQVGNTDLTPEKSDTLTLGMVLSPRGWAQGMRLSADYYSIKVRDGIYTPYSYVNPIQSCWQDSGNVEPLYASGTGDPAQPGINGLINDALAACREIAFGTNEDGTRNLEDIVSLNAGRPSNGLPYQRRGLDFWWNYGFDLSRVIDGVPGSLSLTVRGTRALESSGIRHSCTLNAAQDCVDTFTRVEQVGQIRSGVFIPGVLATPRWTGNVISAYRLRRTTLSLSARYVGGARLDNTWSDDRDEPAYADAAGRLLYGSVDDNRVEPYLNFGLAGSYALSAGGLQQVELFGSISNLFDKSPPFTGGSVSGASAQYHDTMGRAYRIGLRMHF